MKEEIDFLSTLKEMCAHTLSLDRPESVPPALLLHLHHDDWLPLPVSLRGQEDMVNLIRTLRALRAQGATIAVVGFNLFRIAPLYQNFMLLLFRHGRSELHVLQVIRTGERAIPGNWTEEPVPPELKILTAPPSEWN